MEVEPYLTIGEFAKLRSVDRKSLRYYERIGALVPAYIDPATKYRYYKLEQLVDLDTILVCLELGIPLKEAAGYRRSDGTLDFLKLYRDGCERTKEKIKQLNLTMERLEATLRSLGESRNFENRTDEYERHIGSRYVLRGRLEQLDDETRFRNEAKALFTKAQALGLVPVINFPVGLMAEQNDSGVGVYITLELLPHNIDRPEVITLPEGTYRCRQECGSSMYGQALRLAGIKAGSGARLVTVSNMTLEEYEAGVFPLEIQAFAG